MVKVQQEKRPLAPHWFYIAALVVAGLDQFTKALVLLKIPLGEAGSVPVIPNVFHLTHVRNTGIAFSMLEGKIPVILLASALVMIGIVVTERKSKGTMSVANGIALSLPLGGAIGNMIDRLRFGNVVDFIDVRAIKFAIFNVADSAITVGIIWLLLISFFQPTRAEQMAASDPQGDA